jgi:hypothetical protein
MRRLLIIVLVVTVLGMVREVMLEREPRRSLHEGEPVIGSLDTWPKVPRRPAD